MYGNQYSCRSGILDSQMGYQNWILDSHIGSRILVSQWGSEKILVLYPVHELAVR
jgi:hypothetical protein